MEKWHCTSYLKISCFQATSATSKNKMCSALMLDMVKHHSGNWEGVKGPLDQWLTVLAKATCAVLTKTSNDCLCLNRHKNWKSHPEKMVRNAAEWSSRNSRGRLTHRRTHTISHPRANWTLRISKGSTWIMQAAATNHIEEEKQNKKTGYQSLSWDCVHPTISNAWVKYTITGAIYCLFGEQQFPSPASAYCLLCNSHACCNFSSCKDMKRKYTGSTHWRQTVPKQKTDVKQTALFLL